MNTFIIKRTDDTVTKETVQSPDKLKQFASTEEALAMSTLVTNQVFSTTEDDYSGCAVFDRAELGNLNPITSNAVKVLYDLLDTRIAALEANQ